MKVLLADDDAGVRSTLRRVLYALDCEIVEVEDGVAALEAISRDHIGLAIVGLDLPLLDGRETLQAIRTSSRHAALPVVIVGGTSDREAAAAVIRLGVTDFVVKPFRLDLTRFRLMSVLHSIAVESPFSRPAVAAAIRGGQRPVLVVDGSADFRYFVANALTPDYVTIDVDSGHTAVSACAAYQPKAIIVAADIGVFGPAMLARKLRSLRGCEDARFILAGSPADAAALAPDVTFDARVDRSFVPEEFASQFRRVMARRFSFDEPGSPFALVRSALVTATEQATGMLAHTAVRVRPDDAAVPSIGDVTASVLFQLIAHEAAVHIALSCPVRSAAALAARMMEVDELDIGLEDARAVVGELLNVIAGRVQAAVGASGGSAKFTLPEIGAIGATRQPVDVSLSFASGTDDVRLHVAAAAADCRIQGTAA